MSLSVKGSNTMDGERCILHIDMNSYYASVEAMLEPSLRGKALAVCGCIEARHGIVLAKSEKAKRAGVKTGMVYWQAKQLCPELLVVEPQYDEYIKYSRLAREIYGRYTDLIEPFGMDEAWIDLSGSGFYGSGMEIAEEIRQAVKDELGLTVSIGVSFNKIFAKLGSDMKKPDAITQITRENFREKVWPLSASELIYIGPSSYARLLSYGVRTIGDIVDAGAENLRRWFGVNGLKMWKYASGADDSRVMHRDYVSPVKSVGHGTTCVSDLESEEEVWRVMLALSQDVGHRLRLASLAARGVELTVRDRDLAFSQYQRRMPYRSDLPCDIARECFSLFRERYKWKNSVRAVTVRAIDLVPRSQPEQLDLFFDISHRDRRVKLEDAVESIRERFGKGALTYASLLGDMKIPGDGRDKVKMPGLMYS